MYRQRGASRVVTWYVAPKCSRQSCKQRFDPERRAKGLVEASRVVIDRLGRLDDRPDSPPSEPAPTFHKVGFLIVFTPYNRTTWGSRGIFNQ
jgi:hypothetical protein